MKIFDVGCGDKPHPKALVCGDLYIIKSGHRETYIESKKLKNFIILDAYNLPFKDKSFDLILSSHVLEHLKNPLSALIEWQRVAPDLLLRIPNLKGIIYESEVHLYTWSPYAIRNLLLNVYNKVEVYENFRILLWCKQRGLIPTYLYTLIRNMMFRLKIFKIIPISDELISLASTNVYANLIKYRILV